MHPLAFVSRRAAARATVLALDSVATLGGSASAERWSWRGDDDRDRFSAAVVDPREDGSSFWMNGDDSDALDRLGDRESRPFLWFRLDGRAYVVRDPALVARAEEAVAESRELGKRQGEIGRLQGEVGRRQGRIGGRQGLVGARQGRLAARLARIETRLAVHDPRDADVRTLRLGRADRLD